LTPQTSNTCRKLRSLSFPRVLGLGGRGQSLLNKKINGAERMRFVLSNLWGTKLIRGPSRNKPSKYNSYVISTVLQATQPPENTPNMASAADNSELPSLPSPVPPCGNDSQRYRDGLPKLFSGRNQPVAAATAGKHGHDASTTCRAFT
jgi:hypothetical protein